MRAREDITLNCDLGELPDEPEELYAIAQVVNIACGGHAGDDASMERAIRSAAKNGAEIAAHPSYADRARFGRVSLEVETSALFEDVRTQCAALAKVAKTLHVSIDAMKPHGALYHDAAKRSELAAAVIDGALAGLGLSSLTIVGPPSGHLREIAKARGLAYAREGFADRAYGNDGHLVPRSSPGALLTDPDAAAAQAISLANRGDFETICVHGDTEGAVVIARAVRAALRDRAR